MSDGTITSRVIEAAIGLAECDSEDDSAFHACVERLRAAAEDWITPPEAKALAKDKLRTALVGLLALRVPMRSEEFAQAIGADLRSAQELLASMRAAGLLSSPVRCQDSRRIRHRLRRDLLSPRKSGEEGEEQPALAFDVAKWG